MLTQVPLLIAILLQMHIPFSLKTALIDVFLFPDENFHSLRYSNRPRDVLTPECSFKTCHPTLVTVKKWSQFRAGHL